MSTSLTRFTRPRPARQSRATRLTGFRRWRRALCGDRGDVPGWVLVAVMPAGLVTAIWLVADDQLTAVLARAIGSVTQP
jgi:hypothetical protein